jgi:transcriptional regulator with XRE-family HTH domain
MMIGKRVLNVREQRGLTLEDLAKRSGVSKATLWRIENDKVAPSTDSLQKIARALEVSVAYLSGDSDAVGDIYDESTLSELERGLLNALREGRVTDALDSFRALLPATK